MLELSLIVQFCSSFTVVEIRRPNALVEDMTESSLKGLAGHVAGELPLVQDTRDFVPDSFYPIDIFAQKPARAQSHPTLFDRDVRPFQVDIAESCSIQALPIR